MVKIMHDLEEVVLSSENLDDELIKSRAYALWCDERSFSLMDFLPYSDASALEKIKIRVLDFIGFFCSQIIETISCLIENKYHEFDPHVGESLCQIRAYMILLIYGNNNSTHKKNMLIDLFNKFRKIRNKSTRLIDQIKKNIYTGEEDEKLTCYLSKNDLNLFFTKELYVLVLCLMLAKYKQVDSYGESINYKRLKKDTGMSKYILRKIVHRYQIELSLISCEFIEKISSDLPNKKSRLEALKLLRKVDDDSRQVLPCHLVMDIIMKHAMTRSNVLFNVIIARVINGVHYDSIHFICRACPIGLEFISDFNENHDIPCVVIEGACEFNCCEIEPKELFISRIKRTEMKLIISNSMARHYQYPGRELRDLDNNFDKLLSSLKSNIFISNYKDQYLYERAQELLKDACASSSSYYLIKHIYCDFPKTEK